ncbi:dna alkylation repair enzyme [Leptolyngbya sp. Heron Island J]|uniref:DNA alkylation repair protein n=1 Tax=Leptolyngbya sp. Heron Island J TaxID=1385935 RepID=UPI0003B9C544|nr:DNA alkylation repair protein [Leptolyngbya sp. Heron Island J]ESA38671.1 dna alkylation repair enzyme [Leptolyngbya sp. Heron Island J]
MTADQISKTLRDLADPAIAEHSQRFFKTGKGEYGEGDQFLGIRVPVLRKQVRHYQATPLSEVQELLKSPFHEERLLALLLLVRKFSKGDDEEKTTVYQLYLDNTQYINNWDLVDSSAYQIVGAYLETRDRQVLYQLAHAKSLWERRIAIMATFHFIRNQQFDDTLQLSELLLNDTEDLIHKAVGWMLREVGKQDVATAKAFLKTHYQTMPRTMLRYAIEKFPKQERQQYLSGVV